MLPIWMHLPCFITTKLLRSIHLFLACDGVARYKVCLKSTVIREYEEIESKIDRRRVLWKIGALADNPRCADSKTLPESEDSYRICLQHHRVVYQVDDGQRLVTVFRIANRRRQSSAW
jgi:mRNA-degrading endonuclease RelE of RelBE toxin-antitoxin system